MWLKRLSSGVLVVLLLALALPTFAQDEEAIRQQVVAALAADEEFADWLPQYPDYTFNLYQIDGDVWGGDFFSNANQDEWIGNGSVNISDGTVVDAFAPKPLPPDVFQIQLDRIRIVVMNDPEIQARLLDPSLWDEYFDWNRWEKRWDFAFYRGLEAFVVKVTIDENDDVIIEEIVNPNELTEEQQYDSARDEAITLAYSAAGIDQALNGHDNWKTYAENLNETYWGVAFVDGETSLLYALVDIGQDKVLDVKLG